MAAISGTWISIQNPSAPIASLLVTTPRVSNIVGKVAQGARARPKLRFRPLSVICGGS